MQLLLTEGVSACERLSPHDVRLTGCVPLLNVFLYLSLWGQVSRGVVCTAMLVLGVHLLIYSMCRTASDASGADTLNYIKMSVKTILILDVKVLQKDSRAYLRGGD